MIDMEHKEEPKVKIDFSFTDEFGQESRLTKTILKVDYNIQTQLELLVEEFKCFMMSAGFSPETVELIQIVEEE